MCMYKLLLLNKCLQLHVEINIPQFAVDQVGILHQNYASPTLGSYSVSLASN